MVTVSAHGVPTDDAVERFHHPGQRWQRWADRAHGAFILHAPAIVALAAALRGWDAPPLVKFLGVAVAATVPSLLPAGALRHIPGARRVL